MGSATHCSVPGCDAALGLPCHSCGAALCWDHGRTFRLVVHCPSCWARDHGTQATQQTSLPLAKSAELVVGDVCLLEGGRHLLVVDVWRAPPPATVGRAVCLLGASWVPPSAFEPVVPHQFALFGFTVGHRLPFERVGGIDAVVAQRYHTEEIARQDALKVNHA